MNVMAKAHKTVKDAIKAQIELGKGRTHTYAQMLSLALKLAHAEYKRQPAVFECKHIDQPAKFAFGFSTGRRSTDIYQTANGYVMVANYDGKMQTLSTHASRDEVLAASDKWQSYR